MSKKRTWIQKASYGMCLGTLLFSPAESWLEDQHPIEALTQKESTQNRLCLRSN
ncbi:hypothetical protein HCA64_12615 [Listeria booriae]|uniref:hypothetical protein n=1 Tax=Listeria booriae TaxID=1552123 RepID=UPI0013584022|nr:hypothetical protein [Listeria booriae]MBC1907321.1 hypothetical protein [Listeria booriae]